MFMHCSIRSDTKGTKDHSSKWVFCRFYCLQLSPGNTFSPNGSEQTLLPEYPWKLFQKTWIPLSALEGDNAVEETSALRTTGDKFWAARRGCVEDSPLCETGWLSEERPQKSQTKKRLFPKRQVFPDNFDLFKWKLFPFWSHFWQLPLEAVDQRLQIWSCSCGSYVQTLSERRMR